MFKAPSMTFDTQVEPSQLVVTKTVGPQLHYDCMRSIFCHDSLHNILEKLKKGIVIHAWLQGNVQGVVLSIVKAILIEATCPWEKILTILMERYSHDSVWKIKCFFDTIAMMDVNVDVDDSGVNQQEF